MKKNISNERRAGVAFGHRAVLNSDDICGVKYLVLSVAPANKKAAKRLVHVVESTVLVHDSHSFAAAVVSPLHAVCCSLFQAKEFCNPPSKQRKSNNELLFRMSDVFQLFLMAVQKNDTETVHKMVLAGDVDVNAHFPENSGVTALHAAASWGKVEIAAMLLNHGADVETCDDDQWTPLHYCRADVKALLLQRGATIERSAAEGETPLSECLKDEERALLLHEGVARCLASIM